MEQSFPVKKNSSRNRIPYPTYHNTKDVPALITPEIIELLAQIRFADDLPPLISIQQMGYNLAGLDMPHL